MARFKTEEIFGRKENIKKIVCLAKSEKICFKVLQMQLFLFYGERLTLLLDLDLMFRA